MTLVLEQFIVILRLWIFPLKAVFHTKMAFFIDFFVKKEQLDTSNRCLSSRAKINACLSIFFSPKSVLVESNQIFHVLTVCMISQQRNSTSIRLKRILKIMILTTITVSIIGAIFIVEKVLPYMPIVPWKRSLDTSPKAFNLRHDTLAVEAEKGLILRGYFIHSKQRKPQATIILVHGIGSNKESYLGYSRILADSGYNVIVYDQRAHGKSDGQYCTFGFYEKQDLSKFVDIAKIKYPDVPVGVQGSSLGGAVALQALEFDERIKFGIIESTFNTLENVVVEYGRGYFKFRSRWLAQRILTKAAAIAKFRPFEIKPVESCKKIEQPVLMIHGDIDEKIPIAFNQENFKALLSKDKEFWIVRGAGHQNVGEKGGKEYLQKILHFINRVTKPIVLAHK